MPELTPQSPHRPKTVLLGVGVLVVAIGFALPQLAPPAPDQPPGSSAPDAPLAATPGPESRPGTSGPAEAPPGVNVIPALARLAGGLFVVCVLCVLATRYLNRNGPQPVTGMKVLASLAVGRCTVHLVSANGRRLLIGTDAGGVKSLIELPGEPESEGLEEQSPATPPVSESVVVGPTTVPATSGREEILQILAAQTQPGGNAPPSRDAA